MAAALRAQKALGVVHFAKPEDDLAHVGAFTGLAALDTEHEHVLFSLAATRNIRVREPWHNVLCLSGQVIGVRTLAVLRAVQGPRSTARPTGLATGSFRSTLLLVLLATHE